MGYREIAERMLVPPGKAPRLESYDPGWLLTEDMEPLRKEQAKARARELLEASRREFIAAQGLLSADARHAVLIELQGRDAAGKDSTIKHTMSGVNPQGCRVHSFKQPTAEERAHDFLWRYHCATPARGQIGIFNRSYYEDVLVARVHPEWLDDRGREPGRRFWEHRFEAINALEAHLVREGTVVLKFFLHISKGEQRKRLLRRLDDPTKSWKFSADDLADRSNWDEFTRAYEDALGATSTEDAPWYIVPADHKWVARTAVVAIAAHAIRSLPLKFPEPPPEQAAAMAAAREQLAKE